MKRQYFQEPRVRTHGMMTWLKTEVDDELNEEIKAYQDKSNAPNKVVAVKELLKLGLQAAETSNTNR